MIRNIVSRIRNIKLKISAVPNEVFSNAIPKTGTATKTTDNIPQKAYRVEAR